MNKPILVFQTDFTYAEGAIAAMYGVVKSVDPTLEIMDATHQIPQYDVYSASYRLFQYMNFWPKGTIFVSVVDPGVGTNRKACVAKTMNGYYVVTPDNGTLTYVRKYFGIEEIREIDENANRLKGKDNEEVAIFHGRDLFGHCAARLAGGIISYRQVGPTYDVDTIVSFDLHEPLIGENSIEGIIEISDPNFGNLWSNIPKKTFEDFGFKYGDIIQTKVINKDKIVFDEGLPYFKAFGMAKEHSVMIYNNEVNKISLAEVLGNLMQRINTGFGPEIKVIFTKTKGEQNE